MHAKNIERARRIATLIDGYPDHHHAPREHPPLDGNLEDAIRDVLADLMHLCEQIELPLDEELCIARANYEQERDNEGESAMFLGDGEATT